MRLEEGLERLRAYAQEYDCDIRAELPDDGEREGYSMAPFNSQLAVFFGPTPTVTYEALSESVLGGMIHELGHILAADGVVKDDSLPEFDWFGWEYALALHVGLESIWRAANHDYMISGEMMFGWLTPERQEEILAERLAYAETIGLVRGGVPLG